jgi:hypothetical protein
MHHVSYKSYIYALQLFVKDYVLDNYMWIHIYMLDNIFVVHCIYCAFVSTIVVNNYQRRMQCQKLRHFHSVFLFLKFPRLGQHASRLASQTGQFAAKNGQRLTGRSCRDFMLINKKTTLSSKPIGCTGFQKNWKPGWWRRRLH